MATSRRVLLKRRPVGEPRVEDFEIEEAPLPEPGADQVLLRTLYLSLDPYMRGRMNEGPSYTGTANPALGDVMVGGTVSEVVHSNNERFSAGDIVAGSEGWRSHSIATGAALRKLDPKAAPDLHRARRARHARPDGLRRAARHRPAEARRDGGGLGGRGAVGSAVGQIAKIKGCRAVGMAGGRAKCEHVVKELGFDACVDYKSQDVYAALKLACPKGIDVYFDNVGGPVLDAVMRLINRDARIPICGLIAEYNATEPPRGPNMRPLLFNRATMRGFIVCDHADRSGEFLREAIGWVQAGRLRYREDIVEGLDNAPRAFIGLLRGENFGKRLIRVGADPTRR